MLVLVGLFGAMLWRRDAKRRRAGLVAPPPAVTLLKIGGALAGGVALVLLCNHDRGVFVPIQGVPGSSSSWSACSSSGRSCSAGRRLGRYFYAIGGNAEAARRAGINLVRIRTTAFVLCSLTAGIAGVVYASRLRSISTSIDGGTLVLYAVAAAVIGGTSLFGGRGKAIHGVLGGIVIAAIDNGMGLRGLHRRLEVHGHGARPSGRRHDRRALAPRPRRDLARPPQVGRYPQRACGPVPFPGAWRLSRFQSMRRSLATPTWNLALATLAFALCFTAWSLIAPFAKTFKARPRPQLHARRCS